MRNAQWSSFFFFFLIRTIDTIELSSSHTSNNDLVKRALRKRLHCLVANHTKPIVLTSLCYFICILLHQFCELNREHFHFDNRAAPVYILTALQ